MRKEWKKPKLMSLNASSTREEEIIDCPEDLDANLETTQNRPGQNGPGQNNKKRCIVPGCNHEGKWVYGGKCKCHKDAVIEGPQPTEPTFS